MRTRVFITIDTEFSIGGAFERERLLEPIGPQNVFCNVDGVSEGLGFMLETFSANDIRATFFVEALQTAYFGDSPMGEIARHITSAGHDVQLHLHPVWTYFDHANWRQRQADDPPNDDFHGRPVDQLAEWMRRGMDTFERWGLQTPVALRTGNLMVDRSVYVAMSETGLTYASNIARGVFEPEEPALRFSAGVHRIEGVTELPVLTYIGLQLAGRRQLKALTITGSSINEIIHLLGRAHMERSPAVVLLTHCHELVKGDIRGKPRANRLNQSRLRELCRFLRDNPNRFDVATMSQMASAPVALTTEVDKLLEVPAWLALHRIVQNKLSDHNMI